MTPAERAKVNAGPLAEAVGLIAASEVYLHGAVSQLARVADEPIVAMHAAELATAAAAVGDARERLAACLASIRARADALDP